MDNKEIIPPDQFERVVRELKKLSRIVDEVQHALDTEKGIRKFEAQRALEKASAEIEVAGYWIGKALSSVMRRSDADE